MGAGPTPRRLVAVGVALITAAVRQKRAAERDRPTG